MSSDKLIILATLMPGAGSNSYKLTTGPLLIFFIFPLIPKSSKIFSINSGLGFFEIEAFMPCFFSNKFLKIPLIHAQNQHHYFQPIFFRYFFL